MIASYWTKEYGTVKTHIKEHNFCFRLILFLNIRSFLKNQSEDVLEVLLLNFLEFIYCFTKLYSFTKWMDDTA